MGQRLASNWSVQERMHYCSKAAASCGAYLQLYLKSASPRLAKNCHRHSPNKRIHSNGPRIGTPTTATRKCYPSGSSYKLQATLADSEISRSTFVTSCAKAFLPLECRRPLSYCSATILERLKHKDREDPFHFRSGDSREERRKAKAWTRPA